MKDEKIDKLIGEIREGHLKPNAKWKAELHRAWPWFLVGAIVIFAGITLAVIVSPFDDFDGRTVAVLGPGRALRVIGGTFLNLWVLLTVALVALGIYAFRKTEKGYRYRSIVITGSVLVVIMGAGLVAHTIRVHERVEAFVQFQGPRFLRPLAPSRGMRIFNPAAGVLIGSTSNLSESSFSLTDPHQQLWIVQYSSNTALQEGLKLEDGTSVLIIGKPQQDRTFEAQFIRSFDHGPRRGPMMFRMERGRVPDGV